MVQRRRGDGVFRSELVRVDERGKKKKGGTAVTGPPVEATRRGVGDGPRAAPRGGEEA
jgi:hypothetical protein